MYKRLADLFMLINRPAKWDSMKPPRRSLAQEKSSAQKETRETSSRRKEGDFHACLWECCFLYLKIWSWIVILLVFFYFVSFVFDSFFFTLSSFRLTFLTSRSFLSYLSWFSWGCTCFPLLKPKTLMANRLKLIFSWTEILLRNRIALALCYAMQRNITAVLDEFNLLSKKKYRQPSS